jgi:sporulation protein YlmC with PRC-barrel domain
VELSGGSWAISELVGRPVRDQSGRLLGRVFEVRAHWQGSDVVLNELMVGRRALWQRLRGPGANARGIPWANVMDVEDEHIVVRP